MTHLLPFKHLLSAFVFISILGLWSCKDHTQGYEPTNAPEQVKKTRTSVSLEDAVYHEGTKMWIAPRKDPYTLANFQQAYNNLASGQSVQPLTRSQASAFSNAAPLEATHYALKIYPRNESEQWRVETMEEVKISYIPFDYSPLSESESAMLNRSRTQNVYPEKGRYLVTYEDRRTVEGSVGSATFLLPILYAVWPCEKPLPAELDYEMQYPIFLPSSVGQATRSSSAFDAETMRMLESEAVALAWGEFPTYLSATRSPIIGQVTNYDDLVKKAVPVHNLKITLKAGSYLLDVYTKSNGSYRIPVEMPLESDFFFVFQYEDKWKLTYEDSTDPISFYMGLYRDLFFNNGLFFNNITAGAYPAFEIHRAVNHYLHGSHSAPKWHVFETRIEVLSAPPYPNRGLFYPLRNDPYIKIYNEPVSNLLIGTVLHELGHLAHYCELGGDRNFNKAEDFVKESFASYVGWHVGESYYCGTLGYVDKTTTVFDNFTGQGRQYWHAESDNNQYSPIFIDLIDTYNQNKAVSSCPRDLIQDVPHSVILHVVRECAKKSEFKSVLSQYVGIYYNATNFPYFCEDFGL